MERVLLLSVGFGSGHNVVAKTLQQKFEEQPDVRAEMVDLLDFIPKTFHPLFQTGYHRMLSKFPVFYHYLYDWTYQSKIIRYLSSEFIEKVGWTIRRKFNQLLREMEPTRIVTTHPFGLLVLPTRWASIPTIGVVTDYELHPIWLAKLPDVLCLPKKLIEQRQIERLHLQAGTRIMETGLPIHDKFYQEISSAKARQQLGLPMDRPVILVIGGGHGHGPIPALVKQFSKLRHFHFVIFTGQNEELRRQLLLKSYGEHIQIEGFRTDLENWMSAADLLVTKPGGVTITEAIVKRLPMLLFEAFPGQEEANKKYLLHHRVAFSIHEKRAKQQVERFFAAHFPYEQIHRAFDRIYPQHAADIIVHETLRIPKPELYIYS